MNCVAKLYPKTIWGPVYDGELDRIVDDLATAGVGAVACPVFEGRRLLFETQDSAELPFSLVPFAQQIQEAGIGFWPVFPVFHDPDTYDSHPQFRPIGRHARPFPADGWYRPICPSHPEYRQFRIGLIREALAVFRPMVVDLDFVRYPFQWETADLEEMGRRLPPYCYCPRCLTTFQETTGLRSPGDDIQRWFEWRASVITDFLEQIHTAAAEAQDETHVVLNVVPSAPDHYLQRIFRTVGQDLLALAGTIDSVSPMLYHLLLKQPISWVNEICQILREQTPHNVLPSLQVVPPDEGGELDVAEFESLLVSLDRQGIQAVALFHWEGVVTNPSLRDLLQSFTASS